MDEKYIFMSYAHKDNNIALPLFKEIGEQYNIWYDNEIEIGSEWDDYIVKKLKNSAAVMIFLSDNYLASEVCENEYKYAKLLKKPIVPVYLYDDVELPDVLVFWLCSNQALYRSKCSSDEELVNKLSSAKAIQDCRRAIKKVTSSGKNITISTDLNKELNVPLELLGGGFTKTTNPWEKRIIDKIIEGFKFFSIEMTHVKTVVAPLMVSFEFKLEEGVSAKRALNYSEDVKFFVGPEVVQMHQVIGASSVIVDVKNPSPVTVTILELLSDEGFVKKPAKLPAAIGKNATGENIILDITEARHILIAGKSTTGKSDAVNSVILSLLFKLSPDDVKFLMIGRNGCDLTRYKDIPHLLSPIVEDMSKARFSLNWLCDEMLDRFEKISRAGARNFVDYNDMVENGKIFGKRLPYIVMIIDELDFLKKHEPQADCYISELAMKSRLVGIHMILTTEKISSDVINSSVLANVPTRLCFVVNSYIDSKLILDESGAQNLLGKGDFIIKTYDRPMAERAQAPSVSDVEIENVIDFIKRKYEELGMKAVQNELCKATSKKADGEDDELLYRALGFIAATENPCASLLMRGLKIGATRAQRILSQLENLGYIGKTSTGKRYRLLIPKEECRRIVYEKERGLLDK